MRKAVPRVVVVVLLAGLLMAFPSVGSTATKSVFLRDDVFSPRTMTIRKGDKVVWRWRGSNPHNVVGRGFRSRVKQSGTYAHTFRRTGRYRIRCEVHNGMRQTITVR
jgi:plastocyanin